MVDRWVRVDGAKEGDLGGSGGGIDILNGNEWKARPKLSVDRCLCTVCYAIL